MTTKINNCYPSQWPTVALGDVCALRAEPVQPDENPNARYVGLEHLQPGNSVLREWGSASEVTSSKSRFLPNDVLFGKLRPYLDKAAIAEFDGICSTDILVLVANDRLDPQFFSYLTHSHSFREYTARTTRGVNHPRTSWSSLAVFEFSLPPLPEQRAIAWALRVVEMAKEARLREAALERERKAALMEHLFTHGTRGEATRQTEISKMPESWRLMKLGEFATTSTGGTPDRTNREYWNGLIPWVKTGEIDYRTITNTEENITQKGLDNSSAKVFPAGTLLMAMFGQGVTRGRVAILGIDAAVNQACAAIVPNQEVSSGYLFHFLSHAYQMIRNLGHGANQKNLNCALIRSIPIPVPRIEEQADIARTLDLCNSKLEGLEKETTILGELFRTLLEELMTERLSAVGEQDQILPEKYLAGEKDR